MSEARQVRRAHFIESTNRVLETFVQNDPGFGAAMLHAAECLDPDDFATVRFVLSVLPQNPQNPYDVIAALAAELIEARTRLCILGVLLDSDRLKAARPLWEVR